MKLRMNEALRPGVSSADQDRDATRPVRIAPLARKNAFLVRDIAPGEVTAGDVRDWSELEARAADPNPCMSPHFVLPALRHLDPGLGARVVLVERHVGGARLLVAAGVFHRCIGNRSWPLPHWRAYTSIHSSIGTPLVDAQWLAPALEALQAHLCGGLSLHCSLVIPQIDHDGQVAQALQRLADARHRTVRWGQVAGRAMLVPASAGDAAARESLGAARHKDLQRCERRLAERGAVTWRCVREGLGDDQIEDFLALEHAGWKGEAGESLRSRPSNEAFFRDMVAGFAGEGRALFTEMRLDGRAIASTSNLVSGRMALAFKIGWDPELRKLSLGYLNELAFVRVAHDVCSDLDYVDSGAAPDSFIGELWPARINMGFLVMPLSRGADLLAAAWCKLRDGRRRSSKRDCALAVRVSAPSAQP